MTETEWRERDAHIAAMRNALENRDQDRVQRLVAMAMNHGAGQQEVTDTLLKLVQALPAPDRQWWVEN